MPVSRHRPNPRVVRDFQRNKGAITESAAIQTAIDKGHTERTERLAARRAAKTAAMVDGGLCKSLSA